MTRQCSRCAYYTNSGTCDASDGEPISPDDLCDDFVQEIGTLSVTDDYEEHCCEW